MHFATNLEAYSSLVVPINLYSHPLLKRGKGASGSMDYPYASISK